MIIPSLSEISSIVRIGRARLGVTQSELAGRSGLSRATIAAIEGDSISEIGINRARRLLDVLSAPQLIAISNEVRDFSNTKSNELGLSIPYDWSNPNISDDALIINVLRRSFFDDVCLVVYHFGFDRVNSAVTLIDDELCVAIIRRMLRNIKNGMQSIQSIQS